MGGSRVKPRDYQVEAAEWALRRDGAVVVMPTGSGKTVIAGLWIRRVLEERPGRRVLVLEPTRILVEQTARFLRNVMGLDAVAVHGGFPRERRRDMWRSARVAVATPETALNDYDVVEKYGYDAVVVDECHHTTGKDAYAKLMARGFFRRRLGLTAHIPPSRRAEIERYIGEIRVWGWGDERIRRYVPPWIGEIYEAELNEAEKRVLEALEEARLEHRGRLRGLVNTAIRWFVRDGALALRESLYRETLLAATLSHIRPLLEAPGVRELHKYDALKRILADHEGFEKAIVFVDRVVVARRLAELLRGYGSVAIYGKAHMRMDVRRVLEKARSPGTRLIVSTSAGEEGLDLPEADLLVIWSNAASPLRFIQRHGRILRLTGRRGLKFVAYIVTPDTPDMDSLLDSLELARRVGVDVPVDPGVIEYLWRRSTRNRIAAVLAGNPMPLDWIAELVNMPRDMVMQGLRRLMARGDVVYIYTYLGKTYGLADELELFYERFREYLDPVPGLEAGVRPRLPEGRGRWLRGLYGDVYGRAARLLERYGFFEGVDASLQVPVPGGAVRQVFLHYVFRIHDRGVLRLVFDNIYSAPRFHRFI